MPGEIESEGGTGREKFRRFVGYVLQNDLARFDVPIRSWAMQEPTVAKQVRRTDRFRLAFAKSLFLELEFNESQANIRAASCIAFLTMDRSMLRPAGILWNTPQLDQLCKFFCTHPE